MTDKLGNLPAYPRPFSVSHGGVGEHQHFAGEQDGLTIRQRVAIAAMQSIIGWDDGPSLRDGESYQQATARLAVNYADALIAELEKSGQ